MSLLVTFLCVKQQHLTKKKNTHRLKTQPNNCQIMYAELKGHHQRAYREEFCCLQTAYSDQRHITNRKTRYFF